MQRPGFPAGNDRREHFNRDTYPNTQADAHAKISAYTEAAPDSASAADASLIDG